MSLRSDGNVGIGLTNPVHKLDVVGDINTTGTFRVNGTAFTGSSQWTTSSTNIYYTTGNVGIANAAPFAPLCVGNSAVSGSDGYIVIGKSSGGGNRHNRIGYNSAFDFVIGDYGNANTAGTWLEQFKVGWQSPANALVVSSSGVSIYIYIYIHTQEIHRPRWP